MTRRALLSIAALAIAMPNEAKFNESTAFLQVRSAAKVPVKRASFAELKLIDNTTGSGLKAKCLDGTAPAYYWRPGVGNDKDKAVIFLEGGGWCFPSNNQRGKTCADRASDLLNGKGSSAGYEQTMGSDWEGFLSGDPEQTKWADWAVAYFKYCDGGSMTGTREEPFPSYSHSRGTTTDVYFRGHYNLIAQLDDLVAARNLSSFTQVILGGSSAGGMACLLKCDFVAGYFAEYSIPVKCMCDAGIFLDLDTVTGVGNVMRTRFFDIVQFMESGPGLPQACVEGEDRNWQQCMFPQYSLKYLTTPAFVTNSLYNFGAWEILVAPYAASFPPDILSCSGVAIDWQRCWPGNDLAPDNLQYCNETQNKTIIDFRLNFLNAVEVAISPGTPHGVFLDACPNQHIQDGESGNVNPAWNFVKINNISIAEAAAGWYFNGSKEKHIDSNFPNNPTCGYPAHTPGPTPWCGN